MPPVEVPSLTSADVAASVRRHYGADRDGLGPEWAVLDEFSLAPGGGRRRADLFAIRAWSGAPKGHERHAIEIKVSRPDLLAELRDPEKAAEFEAVAHRFFIAAPAGLIRDTDGIPAHWGIYDVTKTGCRKRREARRNNAPQALPETAVVEAFRRASRSEARIRGAAATVDDDPARIPALMKQLEAARAAESRAKQRSAEAKRDLRALLSQISAGIDRCVCGADLAERRNPYARVTHADQSPCPEDRYGLAQIDYRHLAARLGMDPEFVAENA